MRSWTEFVARLSSENFRTHWLARMELAKPVGGENTCRGFFEGLHL